MVNPRNTISLLDRMEEIAEEHENAVDKSGDFVEDEEARRSYDDDEVYDDQVFLTESHDEDEEDEALSPFDEEEAQDNFSTDDEGEAVWSRRSDSIDALVVPVPHNEDPIENMEYEDQDGGNSNDGQALGYFQSVSSSASSAAAEDRANKRSSFNAFRRVSTESGETTKSAPARTDSSSFVMIDDTDGGGEGGGTKQRRVTVHGRSAETIGGQQQEPPLTPNSRRRFKALYGGGPGISVDGIDQERKVSFMHSIRNRRRSTRRSRTSGSSFKDSSGTGTGTTTSTTMADAVERLGNLQSITNDGFEHVAAAAAVVAASAQNSAKRGNVQFGQGDHVLVMLTLLGMADMSSGGANKESYTVDPVNALGYPQAQGKTESQRQGPFLFVLCMVTQVHFDEDERYYTVRRFDTGTEQRADPGYMEPIRDADAIEVALRAAKRTERSMADERGPAASQFSGYWYWWFTRAVDSSMACGVNVVRRVIPTYTQARNTSKTFVERLIHGEHGFALKFRFSGINFLVLCSLIFLFHDVITLAFLSTDWDRSAAILGLFVWAVLVFELILEFLIRPANYRELIQSDKAFAPSTARHMNRYHFICEGLALLFYIPQAICGLSGGCQNYPFLQASLWALTSPSKGMAALGRFVLGLTFLRSFGLARHWKQMWLNHTFDGMSEASSFVRRLLFVEERRKPVQRFFRRKKVDDDNSRATGDGDSKVMAKHESSGSEGDQQLKNAATIGTALMVVNSHRALFILLFIICVYPMLLSGFGGNPVSHNQVRLLQANNVISNTTGDCAYLKSAVQAWFKSASVTQIEFGLVNGANMKVLVQWAQLLPVRCDWQRDDGVITYCLSDYEVAQDALCNYWDETATDSSFDPSPDYFAGKLGVRVGGMVEIVSQEIASADFDDGANTAEFIVRAIFNETQTIALTYLSLFLLVLSMVVFCLLGLTVMRGDAERLVLFPLQRMLLIVVRYAENPLSTPTARKGSLPDQGDVDSEEQLGVYETEQLINTIAKIADLLRKCWGVAGAGIISSNLARTKDGRTVVFNPTIPGKQVYALFGFIGINDFSKQLRALEQDVMILINDVARVVHDEVYRWALGDSGQCNKNLGAAFLMVYRIGDFLEVHDKKKRATDVVFDSQMKNGKVRQRQGLASARRRSSNRHFDIGSGGTLQLASLPGIQAFADRALLGCLKSFAGLHRDQKMQRWQKEFRLTAGVGTFQISVIYGMDAGWAVEGAVGSEYKIDATYLSPHVNMASRMMSACKQYGVKVLLSQGVEELLSKTARSKLRHLDTVYVKGSNVEQRIYTYDARHEGVDFFLFERSPDQADIEADAYSQAIWDNDQDLKSMRQHVTDEFMKKFHQGVEQYLEGNWKVATQTLEAADDMMFEAVLEQGYVDYVTEDLEEYGKTTKTSTEELALLKNDFGDGACKCLIQYMQRRDFIPPPDWHGVRHLMSK